MRFFQVNTYTSILTKGLLSVCILIFFLFSITSCSEKRIEQPVAVKGLLDLRSWDFAEAGGAELKGEWEFYWEKFVRPTQLDFPEVEKDRLYLEQPMYWNNAPKSMSIKGIGYASYHLRILLSPDISNLSLKLRPINTSHFLYANGRIVSSAGGVGETRYDAWAEVQTRIVNFSDLNGELDLVLWVSNFSHSRGGYGEAHVLSEPDEALNSRVLNVGVEMFLVGSILIMALYHLGLYFVQRKDRSVFYFALFCLAVFIRIISSGEQLILFVYPNMGYEWILKLKYLGFYFSLPMFVAFFYKMFPETIHRQFVNVILGVSAVLVLFVILASAYYYSYTAVIFEVFVILSCSYLIYILILEVKERNNLALPFLIGFFVLTLTVVNDIFYQRATINSLYLVPWGLLVFVFSQSFLLSVKFSRAFREVEDLSAELDFVIREQDNIINVRTHELTEKKQSLEDSASLLKETLQELEKTNVQLEYQTAAMNEAAGVVMLGRQGNIFYVNQTFGKISGFQSSEIIGEKYDYLSSGEHSPEFFAEVKASLMDSHLNWHGEICLRHKEGGVYWQDTTVVPFLDLEGEAYQFLAICFDVTDRKNNEIEVLNQNAELEAHNSRIADINRKTTASINYATRIQRAVLPKRDILAEWFSDDMLYFQPRDLVSGDFYFFSEVEGYLFVAVADSTGHGVPGGFMSMLGIAFLNEIIVSRRILEPSEILTQLRDMVIQALNQGGKGLSSDGMDLSLCRFERNNNEFCFASANHALNIVRSDEVLEFKGNRQPIGSYPVIRPFTQQEISIKQDDWLYLYSDGYYDQLGSQKRRKYSKKRLRELLTDIQYFPSNKQQQMLMDEQDWWRKTSGQTDDVLILGLQVSSDKMGFQALEVIKEESK